MLRQARQQLGLTIADVAAVTRIPRNMLEHLERDRFDEYAASVFARGHLMNFAREVRLDPNRVLLAYERQSGERRPSQAFEPPVTKPIRSRRIPSLTTSARVKASSRQPAPRARAASRHPLWARILKAVRPVHMAGLLLMLCALFASAFFLNGSSATAQHSTDFEEPSVAEDARSLERDAEQARWFLERPAAASVHGAIE